MLTTRSLCCARRASEGQLRGRGVAGRGAGWGDDAPGQKFASFYVHSADALLQQISVFAGAVEGIADAINQMADNYGISEEANVNKMRALEEEMQ